MAKLWVSPTEPPPLKEMADVVSMHPEEYGVDVLIHGLAHSIGIQRKTISDLLASLQDGRLAEQVAKMQRLDFSIILLEGRFNWTGEGHLISNGWGEKLSKSRFRRMILSILAAGVHVEFTVDLNDTLEWVEAATSWADAYEHSTLQAKGRDVRGQWGEKKTEHYRLSVLCSFPGIGPELARRILDEIGWPMELTGDLLSVKGLGKKKFDSIKEVFDA
jgi:ERCC4-type nuclease